MDLKSTLLRQHSRENASKIAHYVGDDPVRFKKLVNIYLAGPYRVTQRAAWPLSICAELHPELISPHLKEILEFLKAPDAHDAVKRNALRLLQFIEIPSRYRGKVIDICFNYLQGKSEPVAVKVFAMSVLSQLVDGVPELSQELRIIIEDQLPYASAGFISRARKVLKDLR